MSILKVLYFSLVIFLFSCTGNSVRETQSFVYDRSALLSAEDFRFIDSLLASYHTQTSAEIFVYLDPRQAGTNTDSLVQAITAKAGIGQKGINNGILVYLSYSEKYLSIRLGYAFEWIIENSELSTIIDRSKGFFSGSQFKSGLEYIIGELSKLSEKVCWANCDDSLKKRVFCKKTVFATKILSDNGGILTVQTLENGIVNIRCSASMVNLVEKVRSSLIPDDTESCKINVLERDSNLYLIGVD